MGRILVLGIDGAEPSLLFPWTQAGHLPHFARLLERGAYGPLRSTIHPLTPQAWTSLITGVNPGRHGIFDFGKRAADRYDVELVTSLDRRAPAFWQFVPEGVRVGVANVPLTWPPEPVPGFLVSGMHTPRLADGVWPPEILGELGDGYQIDSMVHWYDDAGAFLRDVFAMHEARHRAFLRLWDHHRPDLALLVYVATDRVQHAHWDAMTAAHRASPGTHGDLGDAIFESYRTVDRALGDWLARMGPDDHLLVVSDHGFGDLRRDVYLNRVLIDAGLLRFDPLKIGEFVPPEPPEAPDRQHAWVHERLPADPSPPTDRESLARGLGDVRRLTFATVDWSHTVAYARGLCGNIWLNLAGREPEGVVAAGEVERVRARVTAALLALVDPDDGRAVVDRVIAKEEIYHGPCLADAPDLLVVMRDYAYTTRGATEFWGRTPVGPVTVGHTGNHRLDGVLAAAGTKIQRGEVRQARIYDVLPTIFHLAGWAVPSDLDGRVLTDLCGADWRTVRAGPPTPQLVRDPRAIAEVEREAILKQLRALGYFG
jgi:predicted AlkP superfamily phosphohydrolase/phosphomutase